MESSPPGRKPPAPLYPPVDMSEIDPIRENNTMKTMLQTYGVTLPAAQNGANQVRKRPSRPKTAKVRETRPGNAKSGSRPLSAPAKRHQRPSEVNPHALKGVKRPVRRGSIQSGLYPRAAGKENDENEGPRMWDPGNILKEGMKNYIELSREMAAVQGEGEGDTADGLESRWVSFGAEDEEDIAFLSGR